MSEIDLQKILLIWRKNRTRILRRSCTLASVLIALLLFRTPQYTARALFQDDLPMMSMKSLPMMKTSNQEEGHALRRMSSNRILGRVVSDLGLQITSRKLQFVKRPWQNLRAEADLFLEEREAFHFSHVQYEGERPLHFSLRFLGGDHFAIKDQAGITLGAGFLGTPTQAALFSFTLMKKPDGCEGEHYFTLAPKWQATESLKKTIRIRKDRDDPAMLKLFATHPDRHLAQTILQSALFHYRSELQEEKRGIAASQLAHLQKRRQNLQIEHNTFLKDHLVQLDAESYAEQLQLQEKTVDSQILSAVQRNLIAIPEKHATKKNLESKMQLNQKAQKMLSQMVEECAMEKKICQLRSRLIDPPTLPVKADRPLLLPIFIFAALFLSAAQILHYIQLIK